MVATYFPGKGTLFEQSYLEGQAKGREEGRVQGLEEGLAKGLAKGLEQGRDQGWQAGREEGLKLGAMHAKVSVKAQDVLRVLGVRGLSVPDPLRELLDACTDLAVLDSWLVRAVTVGSTEELFGLNRESDTRQQGDRGTDELDQD